MKAGMRSSIGGWVLLTLFAFVPTVCAQNAVEWRVDDGGNGHWYEILDSGPISWQDAAALARLRGGHLATLSGADECEFTASLLPSDRATLVGGYQDTDAPDYAEPDGGWRWITGETWDYTNWLDWEPDDGGGVEHYLYLPNTLEFGGSWGDGEDQCANCNPPLVAIEYDADCNGDGIVDYGQIRNGTFTDLNGNGVPDRCEIMASQWETADGGNGHWYAAFGAGPGLTWQEAAIAAEAIGGHLATPSTETENVWLFDTLGSDPSLWNCGYGPFIGGYQDVNAPDYQEPDGGWRWLNGEVWDYTGWQDGGPDNCCGGQANLQFGDGPRGDDVEMAWNDVGFDDSNACFSSFLIEWSADCNGDGIVDYGQILDGTFEDSDGNGVPDCCDNGEQCSCRVDLTEDGEVDTLDFLLFLGAWAQGDPIADWDDDGRINTRDFLDFLNDWVEGC